MDEAEKDCNKKIRKFQSSLRKTDPNGMLPKIVADHHEAWYRELDGNLEDVVESISRLL